MVSRGEKFSSIWINVFADRVVLDYKSRSHSEEWKPVNYPVYLGWPDCHLGGTRAWFLCPGRGCNGRVAILYSGSYFVCRHCHNLAYSSQREPEYERLARRAEKIR
jgi:hypothetical protein